MQVTNLNVTQEATNVSVAQEVTAVNISQETTNVMVQPETTNVRITDESINVTFSETALQGRPGLDGVQYHPITDDASAIAASSSALGDIIYNTLGTATVNNVPLGPGVFVKVEDQGFLRIGCCD